MFSVCFDINEYNNNCDTAIALGMFDGMHIGHFQLIKRMVAIAKEKGLTPCVYTFSNHISTVLGGEFTGYITSPWSKLMLMSQIGVERVIFVPFTKEFANIQPSAFIKNLKDELSAKMLFCGFNFTFGDGGRADCKDLETIASSFGIETDITNAVMVDGVVSSTRIRQLILEGKMHEVRKLLGRCFCIGGKIVEGKRIGRTIGFPTANLSQSERTIMPPNGVYATFFRSENCSPKMAITNIGVRPTFEALSKDVSIETHIIGFDKNLYGMFSELFFIEKIRDEITFGNADELALQIKKDEDNVKKLLQNEDIGF